MALQSFTWRIFPAMHSSKSCTQTTGKPNLRPRFHISLRKTAAAPRQSTKHQLECPKMCPVPSTAMWGTAFLLPDYCRRRCLNRLQNVGQRDLAQRDWDLLGQSLPCLPLSYIGFVFVGDSQTSPGSFFWKLGDQYWKCWFESCVSFSITHSSPGQGFACV